MGFLIQNRHADTTGDFGVLLRMFYYHIRGKRWKHGGAYQLIKGKAFALQQKS
jgi:hypothetical protein